MYIAKWKNLVTGREGSPKFETLEAAQAFVDEHKAKGTAFGKGPRTVLKGSHPQEELLKLSEFSTPDLEGNPIEYVSLKAEYEVEIKEIIETDIDDPDSIALRRSKAMEKAMLYKKFKDAGELVELYFVALINERSFDSNKKNNLQKNVDVKAILEELKFGRLGNALALVRGLSADNDLFFQEDLDAVEQLLLDLLAS